MSVTAVALILLAAIAHASWNLFGKQGASTGAAHFNWLFGTSALVIYAPVVAVTVIVSHPRLAALNWLFLAGTGILHVGYFSFLQLGYRLGDLSAVYPIGRGSGAMLAAIGGVLLLGERPKPIVVAGIAAIIVGILLIGSPGKEASQAGSTRASSWPAAAFALVTGLFIACYTIWDAYAVSRLHTPPILQCYAAFVGMTAVFAPFVRRDPAKLADVWRRFRFQVLGAAVLAPLAYILVLTALRFTAVSVVAPAREVSVLFGILLGRQLLGEGNLLRRLAAGTAIVTGIMVIAIAL